MKKKVLVTRKLLQFNEDRLKELYDVKLNPIVCDLSLHHLRELWKNRKIVYKSPSSFSCNVFTIFSDLGCLFLVVLLVDVFLRIKLPFG